MTLSPCASTVPVTDKLLLLYHWTNGHSKIVVSSKRLLFVLNLPQNQNQKDCTIPYHTTLHCITLHSHCSPTALLHTPLHCTTLHYTALHYTTQYSVLHFTSLHLQCNAIRQYNAMQFKKIQYNTVHYRTLHNTTLYYTRILQIILDFNRLNTIFTRLHHIPK